MELKLHVQTLLEVSPVHATPGLLPMLPGWDAEISMNVRREEALVSQTLTVGTGMGPITAPAWYFHK